MLKDSIQPHDCIINLKRILHELKERGVLPEDIVNIKMLSDDMQNLLEKNENLTDESSKLANELRMSKTKAENDKTEHERALKVVHNQLNSTK